MKKPFLFAFLQPLSILFYWKSQAKAISLEEEDLGWGAYVLISLFLLLRDTTQLLFTIDRVARRSDEGSSP